MLFRSLASNVLFLKEPKALDFQKRKQQYYSSLREGRSAIVYQSVYPFEGNSWKVKCGDKQFGSGELVRDTAGCVAKVQTPVTPFSKVILLVRNGEVSQEVESEKNSNETLTIPLGAAGTYRVEVWAKMHSAMRISMNRLVPYVFYNPIYLQ